MQSLNITSIRLLRLIEAKYKLQETIENTTDDNTAKAAELLLARTVAKLYGRAN